MTTSQLLHDLIRQIREVPEYFIALKAGIAVAVMGLPVYGGLHYFLHRRQLKISLWVTLNFVGAFLLFGGLAFLLASPLADCLPGWFVTTYLFITCVWAALGAVSLIDVFVIHHYLVNVKQFYVSPPLRKVIRLIVFSLTLLPILRYVLQFNPLALVAIPTIATAAFALAFQDTFKAMIAGIGLGHTIRVGQWLTFQDKEGKVIDVTWVRTSLETIDGLRVHIPNSLLQAGIFTTHPGGSPAKVRTLKICASYDVVPERVKKTLLAAVKGAGIASAPTPQALFGDFTEAGVCYHLIYGVEDYTERAQRLDEVGTRVWHAFQREGLSISYPARTIQMQNGADTAKKTRTKKSL